MQKQGLNEACLTYIKQGYHNNYRCTLNIVHSGSYATDICGI